MRVGAYILLGDPRWLRQSVSSYYDRVERIIALGDEHHRAWDGTPLPVRACIEELKRLDHASKVTLCLEDLVDPQLHRMQQDTHARRMALQRLADVDWVLQLDADEVMVAPERFFEMLRLADSRGVDAMDYPSRWMLGRTSVGGRNDLFLEASDALLRVASHYPGPLAVRPNVHLNYSRRAICEYFRVDLRRRNTYHEYTWSHPVHAVVQPAEAILHLSWVDREDVSPKTTRQHGHAGDHAMEELAALRDRRLRHPLVTVATTPFRAGHGHPHRLRLTRLRLTEEVAAFDRLLEWPWWRRDA